MVNEFEFIGITSQRDAAICLASIDKPIRISSSKDDIILSQLFFPLAYADGIRLTSCAEELWEEWIESIVGSGFVISQI